MDSTLRTHKDSYTYTRFPVEDIINNNDNSFLHLKCFFFLIEKQFINILFTNDYDCIITASSVQQYRQYRLYLLVVLLYEFCLRILVLIFFLRNRIHLYGTYRLIWQYYYSFKWIDRSLRCFNRCIMHYIVVLTYKIFHGARRVSSSCRYIMI